MKTISELFDYFPGNHGLTEEIMYEHKTTSQSDSVPIFSGSKNNLTPVGFIGKNAKNNAGRDLSYFEGPCLVLTKDGSAGLLTYIDSGIFTINHHACVLKVNSEWEGRLDLEWFAYQYRKQLYQYTTSKSDNAVLSTKLFDRVVFEIPNPNVQSIQKNKKKLLSLAIGNVRALLYSIRQIAAKTCIELEGGQLEIMGDIFHFHGGNSDLTRELIYYNQPSNEDERIPIFSGATLDANMMGSISREARPGGRDLKLFSGPAILVARKGYYAGTITYINAEEFATNDDAYVLIPKRIWKKKVNLRWFVYQYQELFHNITTSKSDNATFSKEYAQKKTVNIPNRKIQDRIAKKLHRIDDLINSLGKSDHQMEELLGYQIV
ncbi:restriction endonuclease subunit S [Candidatus Poribacteria bacterium]